MSYLALSEEFPVNYKSTPVNANQPAKVETTTLSSGAKLIVSDKYAKRVALEVAVQAGSAAETAAQKGAAHFLASAAFVGNQKNTGTRLVHFMESLGADFSAHADREKIVYRVNVMPEKLDGALSAVTAALSSAPYADHVYEEHREQVAKLYETAQSQTSTHLHDLVHEAAFGESSGFGQSFLSSNLSSLSVQDIKAFREQHFVREKVAVSVDGVSVAQATQLLDQHLQKLPGSNNSNSSSGSKKVDFVGGEVRVRSGLTSGQSAAALGFSLPTGEQGKAADVLALVLPSLLREHKLPAAAFSFRYNSVGAGLFGLRVSGSADEVNAQLAAAAQALKSLRTVDAAKVEAMKKKAAMMKVLALEGSGRSAALLDTLLVGSNNAAALADLRTVTATDLQQAAVRALQSLPAYAVFGNTSGVHSLSAVQKLFQ